MRPRRLRQILDHTGNVRTTFDEQDIARLDQGLQGRRIGRRKRLIAGGRLLQIGSDVPPDAIEHPCHDEIPAQLSPNLVEQYSPKTGNTSGYQFRHPPRKRMTAALDDPIPAGFPPSGMTCGVYSAATCRASAGSTFAAQNLNSGIFPNGSSAGLVRIFAAASTNAKGMNTTPSGMPSSWRELSSTSPRRVVTRTMSPGLMPSLAKVPRESEATAAGSSASRTVARRVIAPVCQCSS